jgi:hypothetical protein
MKAKGASDLSGKLPGQVFNREAEWADILEPHGWTFSGRSQQHLYWCRPGKDCGTLAASGYGGERDWLCVFSSNAEGLEPGLYTKFAVYAVLNHDGDFHDAASDLYHQGFRVEESPLSDFDFRGFFE